MRGLHWFLGLGLLLAVGACAESTPGARSANDENESTEGDSAKMNPDDPDWYDSGSSEAGSTDTSSGTKKAKKPSHDTAAAAPEFKEGMSVNDAINAIPQGMERVNIDQEDLDAPLMNPDFYKSCKLSPSQHFTIKFAVWDGHAVGIDITSQPTNKNLENCLRGLVGGNTWKDKVKSLNISTVTF